jgi:regulator of RNase E activity RraB
VSDQLSFQLSAWAEQLQQRKELQDSLSTPREVNHFFTFKDKKSADEASITLRELNFDVTVAKRGLFKAEVSATHVSDLQDKTVRSLITQMVAVAEDHSGEYDGFGATVEKLPD